MILDLGFIDYEESYKTQKELVRLRKLGEIGDSLIIAEHPPIFTIGRIGKKENLLISEEILAKQGIKVLEVDRGGDITFHGPGQLIFYPVIGLKDRGKDLHKYIRDLEEAVISFLKEYSVSGYRLKDKTGVWVNAKKIASIGIAASDWVTYHGFSINMNTDLGFFSMIHPCGLRGVKATSLEEILNKYIDFIKAKETLLYFFNRIFKLEDRVVTGHAILA